MGFVVSTAIAGGTAEEAAHEGGRALRQHLGGRHPEFILVFASLDQPLEALMPQLSLEFPGTVLLGCTTAGEFTQRGARKGTVSLLAVAGDVRVFAGLGQDLEADPAAAVNRALAGFPCHLDEYPHQTAVLLLDPLAGNGEDATLHVAAQLGAHVPLVGGAAGDYLNMKKTRVALGDQVATDALVTAVLFTKVPLGVGVCHGHRPLSAPLRVTRSTGSVVQEIEGRPAWQVWMEQVRDHACSQGIDPETLEGDEVGAFLLRYEAGLAAGSDLKIRAPLALDGDNSILFACAIPEGSVIRITESEPKGQVDSAREAARRARVNLRGEGVGGAVVFDCICRNLILGERFDEAVRSIHEELEGAPLAGFETYGEIALEVGQLSGFHNTTTVVLAFPR